ncbi:hypothetical protein OVA24_18840 [Luteolibacter sp. SL250]|jgi:hypothetical protein|uniref:hypothetical protein n=1 Tax=Luteolibacter sp. SL250 TaxID=2995170 RepID=UPI0022715EAD|nr:hypothetical protein [Luteolibacter sp. SL250]WAC19287.1 hypothetical protein OVA24_18840 [Luteolibacter sp. SL250]
MNTSTAPKSHGLKFFVYLATLLLVAFVHQTRADVPDGSRSSLSLSGMYKVAASNDPFFPAGTNREWFMDFNSGITSEKASGKVAVSLRQNPNVKVRIMVWQVFPGTNELFLGNQFSEGSRQAVSVAQWRARNAGDSVVLERHGYQIVLNRADPADY